MSTIETADQTQEHMDDDAIFNEIDALLEESSDEETAARDSSSSPAVSPPTRGTKRGRSDAEAAGDAEAADPKRQAQHVPYTAGPDNNQEVNEPAILKSVQLIGGDLALQVLGEALAIQQAGGQMVPSGNRKRTAGGVYFNLLRQHLNPGQFKQVFLHNKELFREKILRKNRRRNARKREKQGPQRRGAMDSPPVTAAPATVLASALPAWMAAAAGGGSSGGGGAGSAAEGGQESGSGGAHGAAHITVAASTVDAELDAELAELDALLDGDE